LGKSTVDDSKNMNKMKLAALRILKRAKQQQNMT